MLQQTNAAETNTDETLLVPSSAKEDTVGTRSVLEEVIERATARNELEQEIKSKASLRS